MCGRIGKHAWYFSRLRGVDENAAFWVSVWEGNRVDRGRESTQLLDRNQCRGTFLLSARTPTLFRLTLSTATVGCVEACATRERSLLSYPEDPYVALKPYTRACRSEYAKPSVRSPSATSYSNSSVCGNGNWGQRIIRAKVETSGGRRTKARTPQEAQRLLQTGRKGVASHVIQ